MRLRSLSRESGLWSPLEFHPALTVLVSEDDGLREHLVGTLADLYALAGSDVVGSIEYSGFEMPLDQTSVVSLDLHGGGPVLLDATDLHRIREKLRETFRHDTEQSVERLGEDIDVLDAKVLAALRTAEATEAAVGAGSEELAAGEALLEQLAEELDQLRQRPEVLAGELADAQERLAEQESITDRVETITVALTERLDPLGDYLSSLRIGDPTEHIREELAELIGLGHADGTVPTAVLEWLEQMQTGEAAPSATVVEHLEEIRRIDSQWQELARVGVEGDAEVIEARAQHDRATERLAWLEELAESGLLADRARAEIDEAHESGDVTAESEVLERYGFESYLDYTIALSTRSVSEALNSTLSDARVAVVGTSDALDAARAQSADTRTALGDRRQELRERVRASTGVDADELSVEALSLIPQRPAELDSLGDVLAAALEGARERLESCRADVASITTEIDELGDGSDIEQRMEAERRRLDELESLLVQATEVRDANVADLEAMRGQQAALQDRLDHGRELLESLEGAVGPMVPGELDAIVDHVAERVSGAGKDPVPLVLVQVTDSSEEDPEDVLQLCSRLASITQVVFVSGDDRVIRWAKHLNADAGILVRPGRRAWLGRRLARRQRDRSAASSGSD